MAGILALTRIFLVIWHDHEARVRELVTQHRGRREAIAMGALARETALSTRTVQCIVSHLIAEHGMLIGSATTRPAGYYLVTDEAEIKKAVAQLHHRLISLAKRAAALQRTSVEAIFGQLRMEL